MDEEGVDGALVIFWARALADHLPPNGAALPHTEFRLGEYRTAILVNLREALARYFARQEAQKEAE
jgi:hypothetical protein